MPIIKVNKKIFINLPILIRKIYYTFALVCGRQIFAGWMRMIIITVKYLGLLRMVIVYILADFCPSFFHHLA